MRVTLLGVLATAAILVSCGGDDGGVDRGSHTAVFAASMRAVAERDLDSLWPLLTPAAKERLERLLRSWQDRLRDPEHGRYLLTEIEERRGPLSGEEVELAKFGTLRDIWDFFLLADPRPASPPHRPPNTSPDGRMVHYDYEHPPGTTRTVRLVSVPSGWYVDDLQL